MLIDLVVELLPDLVSALLGAHLTVIELELDGAQRTVMQKDDSDGPLVGAFLAASLSEASCESGVGWRNCKTGLAPAQIAPTVEGADGGKRQPDLNFQNASGRESWGPG